MSKSGKKLLKLNKNEFIDRHIRENETFPELLVRLESIDSVFLLLSSNEEMVLKSVLGHIMEYIRRNYENISLLKEKNLLELLLQKEFYRASADTTIKRMSLFVVSMMLENMNCLVELDDSKLCQIVNLGLSYYIEEDDDFCCEYLSVVLNKCAEDPHCIETMLKDSSFVLKYFSTISTSANPDVLLQSLEIMKKILLTQDGGKMPNFTALDSFPINRLMCELNCEYFEIREAVLKVLLSLVSDASANNFVCEREWAKLFLEQLTKMFCESLLPAELNLLAEVLAAAMEHELMISLFFELNLFDIFFERINDKSLEQEIICKALRVLTECAKCVKFVNRLVDAGLMNELLRFIFDDANPAAHILLGLNRLIKSPKDIEYIHDEWNFSFSGRILRILQNKESNIKTREQAANLLQNLFSHSFDKIVCHIFHDFQSTLADIFAEAPEERSIDLLLTLLNIIEISEYSNFRKMLCENNKIIFNISNLLMNSFSAAILVTHILRCLCTLVTEEAVHEALFNSHICSSVKRALQSSSNQVGTAATNFIMQSTRFPKFVKLYVDSGVLEVLLLNPSRAICIPTWTPAIESILSKNPTLKFCIRNNLGFTDITVGSDFMVSKRKFNDFRLFQCILNEEVSPLQPVIVVNFNRPANPEDLVVRVPLKCGNGNEVNQRTSENEWCYCRSPGDEFLPKYLEEVIGIFKSEDLPINPLKQQRSCDFDSLAKRAKVIAEVVARVLGNDLKILDLNSAEECSDNTVVKCNLKKLCLELHCSFVPLGRVRSGCEFERAILFKALADQVGLPCTLQRSVDGRVLFNELPMPVELDQNDFHCDNKTLTFTNFRMLRPTHIIDLMYNVGELYPLQSRQALKYLRFH